jgi:hypothetical protein
MKTICKALFLTFCGSLIFQGCYYDVEEELYPAIKCDTSVNSFTNSVVPILSANCYSSCHAANVAIGGVNLEGYDNVKLVVDNGKLLKSVKHEAGASAMPKSGNKLNDCNISKIERWIKIGAPNN